MVNEALINIQHTRVSSCEIKIVNANWMLSNLKNYNQNIIHIYVALEDSIPSLRYKIQISLHTKKIIMKKWNQQNQINWSFFVYYVRNCNKKSTHENPIQSFHKLDSLFPFNTFNFDCIKKNRLKCIFVK